MKTTLAALVLLTLVACGSPAETQPGAGGPGGGSDGECRSEPYNPEVDPTPPEDVTNSDCEPGSLTPYDPESPVSCPPDCGDGAVGDDLEPGKPKIVEPRPGMEDLRPVGWEEAKVLGPRRLLISYWSGVEPCNVLDHVEVAYSADEVEVTLFEGSDPADKDGVCIEIALLKGVKLNLDEPLAGRKLTDGAP